MKDGLLARIGRRSDLPTYLGGWLAAVSWLTAVGWSIGNTAFNILILTLTTGGFAVSFWLRGFQRTPQWPALAGAVLIPSNLLRLAFFVGAVVPGLLNIPPLATLIPNEAVGMEEWQIGAGFMWAMALYSFGVVSDGLVAFGSVFGLAMLGLTASANVNPEIGLAFLLFLLGNVLLLSNVTLAHHSGARREGPSGQALLRWLGDQTIVAGVTVALTALGAVAVAAVLQAVSPGLLVPSINLPAALTTSNALPSWLAFSDQMAIGVGGAAPPPTPVLRVEADGPRLWRRRVYDTFNSRFWQASAGNVALIPVGADDEWATIDVNREAVAELAGRRRVEQTVVLLMSGDLVAPALVTEMSLPPEMTVAGRLDLDQDGNVRAALASGTRLTLVSAVPDPTLDELRTAPPVEPQAWLRYLRLPPRVRDAVLEQGQRLARGQATPADIAAAIQHWLESEFTYDLAAVLPEREEDPLAWYFRTRHGACDLIATAMALLARANGIPARVAVGYAAGTREADGSWLIRLSDAHAWAELYFPGFGWVNYNPAVPAAEVAVTETTAAERTTAWRWRRRTALQLACGLLGLWLLGYILRELRRGRPRAEAAVDGRLAGAWRRIDRALTPGGAGRRPAETLAEHLRRVAQTWPEAPWLPELRRFVAIWEPCRYGWRRPTEADWRLAEAAARRIVELTRGRPKQNRPATPRCPGR